MTFDEYEKEAMKTALVISDDFVKSFLYRTLGLVGEAGEVAEKVKKIIRDKNGELSPEDKQELVKEMGDVLWYLQALSNYLGVPLEEVAKGNLTKLQSRKSRDALHGAGDNR